MLKISAVCDDALWMLASMLRDSAVVARYSSAAVIDDAFNDALEAFDDSVRQLMTNTLQRLMRIADEGDRDRHRQFSVLQSKKELCRGEMEKIGSFVRKSLDEKLDQLKIEREEEAKYKMVPCDEDEDVVELVSRRMEQAKDIFILNITVDATHPVHTVLARKADPECTITKEQLEKYLKVPFSTRIKQMNLDPAAVKITSLERADDDEPKLCAISYQQPQEVQAPVQAQGAYGQRPAAINPTRYQIGTIDLETMEFKKLVDSDIPSTYLFRYRDLIISMDMGPTKLRVYDKTGAQITSKAFETTTTSAQATQINLCPVMLCDHYLVFMSLGGEIVRIDLNKEIVAELLYVGNKVRCFTANNKVIYGVDDANNLFTADIERLEVLNQTPLTVPREIKEIISDKPLGVYYGAILSYNSLLIFSKYTKSTIQHQAIQSFRLSDLSLQSTKTVGIEGANSRFDLYLPFKLHGIRHLLLLSNQGFSSAYLFCIEGPIILRRVVKLTSEGSRGVGDKQSACLRKDGKVVVGFSTKDQALLIDFN